MACNDESKRNEGKGIVEGLAKLKYELQHDRQLRYTGGLKVTVPWTNCNSPMVDDGKPDVQAYNNELEALNNPTWFSVPWLYAECYLYR